ncbi:Tyrosine kinase receptor Cad96Ca [Harpegnathos saltator]|uniref:receptor protein-tyrosine kinase n=1 Tax=Harpegnathos saltator TaxID=610380 RepID=E2BE02_HARSA|nr:Tyrosine kinase receptor Cad96Ca [Harpegnathos saltator]
MQRQRRTFSDGELTEPKAMLAPISALRYVDNILSSNASQPMKQFMQRPKMNLRRSQIQEMPEISPSELLTFFWKERHPHCFISSNAPAVEQRQGRVSLHVEMPSKAKREQALRNILARRRQILSQRSHEPPRLFPSRTARPSDAVSKDLPDILETQETRHGVYVSSARTEASVDEETLQSPKKPIEKTAIESEAEEAPRKALGNDSSSSSSPMTTESHELVSLTSTSVGQKSNEPDARRKNTVAMSESLYKHFRPVESNIPVEDMSQFLYFGQKLQPDAAQNGSSIGSGNTSSPNSVETTSTVASSRRRYSAKRPGATQMAAGPVEEIVNEEMNIALERRTVEKNQVSRIKNSYRSSGSGLYFRKARPADVGSNVIPGNVLSSPALGGSDAKSEINTVNEKLRADPSAHADRATRERGSEAHVAEPSMTTQIPRQRQRQLSAADGNVDDGDAKSELKTDETARADTSRGVAEGGRKRTSDLGGNVAEFKTEKQREAEEETVDGAKTGPTTAEKPPEQKTATGDLEVTTSSAPEASSRSRDNNSNIIETSPATRDADTKTSPSQRAESSTLRIVVPDESFGRSFAIESERARQAAKNEELEEEKEEQKEKEEEEEEEEEEKVKVEEKQKEAQSSPLLLPRAGDGIDPARAPAGLSAGATVEPAATVGTSPGAVVGLVGERARKVVPQVQQQQQQQQQQQRVTSQRAIWSAQEAPNDSLALPTSRPAKPTEAASSRGSVRWSLVKPKISEQEVANDRRFLRKSASAVLNQRSTVHEEVPSPLASKRRRVLTSPSGLSTSPPTSRRVKSSERPEGAKVGRVLVVDDRSDNRTVASRGKAPDDEVPAPAEVARASGLNEVPRDSSVQETTAVSSSVLTTAAMVNSSRNSSATGEAMDATEPSVLLDSAATTEEDRPDVLVADEDVVTASSAADRGGVGRTVTPDKGESDANTTTSEEIATIVAVSEQVAETTMSTTSTTSTSPAAPVFPVTPRILAETDKTTAGEASTLRPSDGSKPREVNNQPSGITTDLDPSEIQKRYRAKEMTSATPAPPTTTASPGGDDSGPAVDASPSSTGEPEVPSVSASKGSGRRVSGERSPEVRARNLSDKSKDKDEDVLPIMHLYNTSDIFNGSGPMDGFARGTERPRLVLPVSSGSKDEATAAPTPAKKSTSEPATRLAGATEVAPGGSTSTTTVAKAKEPTASPPSSRKDKHEEQRESQDTSAPASRGASTFAPASGNRTRYRPSYHHSILPEYNGTMYSAGLNRTFLEIGPISVSPRESMNISEVISKRHDGDAIATQETVAVVSYILATLVVFPIAVGVGLILRRLILRNRKVLEESDTSSEISCRKDALNLENGDFKTSIEKAITKLPRIQHLCHEAEKPPPSSSQESRWEFPRDKLRLQTVLGQGNFGQVWKAEADDLTGHQGTTRLVAVKTVKEGASDREKEDLVRELEIMQQLGSHPNVVTLLGCCTEEEPHYLILEYVMYGKLLAYLRDHRTRQYFYNFSEDSAALTSRDLTVFGYCVARGMEYLASKKIIHRDLAARNVLVDHNKLCKIADFGMSRFANEDGEVIETRHGRNALPIRWMAPESLIYSLFTTKTDVWSFGILMWEIVTLGSTPYPDMTAREVMRNVHNGYRLERPSHCRSELFRVISRCWHADPDRRPEFQTLRRDLAQLLEDNMNGHYVDLESFASECTD